MIIVDAMPPDAMPIVLQPDAGEPDVIIVPDVTPDIMPDSTPDMLPDLVPIDALSPPDTECTGGTTITLSPTPIPAPPIEEHCYTRTVYWGVAGCPLTGFMVVWSENPPQNGIVPNDNFEVVSAGTGSWLVHDSNGPGTYYVQVCDSSGANCSNVLTEVITTPS